MGQGIKFFCVFEFHQLGAIQQRWMQVEREWVPNNKIILGFRERYWKVLSLTIHDPFCPKLQNFAFSESSVIWKRKMWHVQLSQWNSRDGPLNCPCPFQVPKKSPKFFSPPTSSDSMSFDRARYYKVNLPILTSPIVLIWELSSFQNFSSFFCSCLYLSKFKNFSKILHLTNLLLFERSQGR